MTGYASCPTCGAALTSGVCDTCEASSLAPPGAPAATAEWRYNGFWERLLVACIPAAVLALFVESTLYGYALYLGVYLTYCAWGQATVPAQTADNRQLSAAANG